MSTNNDGKENTSLNLSDQMKIQSSNEYFKIQKKQTEKWQVYGGYVG